MIFEIKPAEDFPVEILLLQLIIVLACNLPNFVFSKSMQPMLSNNYLSVKSLRTHVMEVTKTKILVTCFPDLIWWEKGLVADI